MGAETQISQLVLEVSAQTALAQRSLNDLARVVQSSTGQMNASLSTVPTTMKRLEGSFARLKGTISGLFAGFVIGGLEESIRHSLEYAGSLAEVSRTLGVTTKDLQAFRYAASQTGVAQDQLEVGLRRLTVSMGKAKLGSEAQAKAFQAIGISADQLRKMDTGETFRAMADGLSKVTDRSQRAAIEMTLMGRSGSTLDNLLAPGAARLNELADAAQRLGVVLSPEQIAKAEDASHKYAALKEVLSAQIAGVVADNANAILGLGNALIQLVATIPQAIEGWRRMVAEFDAGAIAIARDIGVAYHGGQLENPLKAMDRADAALNNADLASRFRADHAAMHPVPRPSGGDLSQVFGGGGGRGRRARSAAGQQDRTAEQEDQFARESAELDAQILAAKRALTSDYNQQADIAEQELAAETEAKLAAIKRQVDGKQISAVQGQLLSDKEREAAAQKQAVIEQERFVKSLEARQQAEDQQFGFQLADLGFADEMATTNGEHRKIQLAILDIQYQQKKADLEYLLLTQQRKNDLEGALRTQAELNRLDAEKAQDQQRVNNGTLDPLGQWAKSVPQNAKEVIEALKAIEAQGIDGLAAAIADVITGTKSLKSAFKDLASSVISDILQMTIKMLIFRALSSVFGSVFGGGGGLGPSLFPVTNGVDPLAALPGRAIGGPVTGGSPYMVGENGPELFVPGASGVIVPNRSRIGAPRAANSNGERTIVELRLNDDMLDARIVQGAAQVVMVSAPSIAKAAHGATMKRLTRPAIAGRG